MSVIHALAAQHRKESCTGRREGGREAGDTGGCCKGGPSRGGGGYRGLL